MMQWMKEDHDEQEKERAKEEKKYKKEQSSMKDFQKGMGSMNKNLTDNFKMPSFPSMNRFGNI